MSASQDKKKRTQQRAEGTERRQVASQKAAAEKKKSRTKWIVGSVLVALLIAFIVIGNSNLFYTAQKAVKINGKSYSVAEFNYEYMSVYQRMNQMYTQYRGDGSMCAPSAPYSEDDESGDAFKTFDDYYKAEASRSLARKVALCELAEKDGVKLDENDLKQIDDTLSQMADAAKQYGYGSLDKFLTANYGNGITKKLAHKLMERDALASKYETYYQDNLTYTDEELDAAYAEQKDELDTYTVHYYFVQAETETTVDADGNETSTATPESMAAAKATAEQILEEARGASEGAAERFAEVVGKLGAPSKSPQMNDDGSAVLDDEGNAVYDETPAKPTEGKEMQGATLTQYGLPFGDWAKDAARAAGDMELFEQENSGYYVALFLGRDDNSYSTVSVRHILIQAEDADGDTVYSEEELAAARAEAEKVLAEYQAGEQTEDAFAALANEHSSDPGSNTVGGLYEDVPKGQMVAEFNDWIYDPARQTGDVDIIEDTSYHGYHVMYFVGAGDSYRHVLARNTLVNDAMTAFEESLTKDFKYESLFAMRYAGVKR